jgi:hypothetical protein
MTEKPKNKSQRICANCVFYFSNLLPDMNYFHQECRRFPPQKSSKGAFDFPGVDPQKDFCGELRLKP